MKTITIYSTPSCHFCHLAKDYLTTHNIAFHDIDVTVDMAARKEMVEMTGQMGVPVIKIEEQGQEPELMVGFSEKLLSEKLGIDA
jgi:glutaredoxin-like YruB-family protein